MPDTTNNGWLKTLSVIVALLLSAGSVIYSNGQRDARQEEKLRQADERLEANKDDIARIEEEGCKPFLQIQSRLAADDVRMEHLVTAVAELQSEVKVMKEILIRLERNGHGTDRR